MPANRGGARPGSGPKPKPDTRMVTRAFVIRQDQEALINQDAERYGLNKSEMLRLILDRYMCPQFWCRYEIL